MKKVFASLVSASAKHAAFVGQYEVDVEVDISGDVDFDPDLETGGVHSGPAEQIHAEKMLTIVADDLNGDQDALAVAMALGEGMTAIETQSQFRLSPKQYDAARKRLRRVVNKIKTEEKIA